MKQSRTVEFVNAPKAGVIISDTIMRQLILMAEWNHCALEIKFVRKKVETK